MSTGSIAGSRIDKPDTPACKLKPYTLFSCARGPVACFAKVPPCHRGTQYSLRMSCLGLRGASSCRLCCGDSQGMCRLTRSTRSLATRHVYSQTVPLPMSSNMRALSAPPSPAPRYAVLSRSADISDGCGGLSSTILMKGCCCCRCALKKVNKLPEGCTFHSKTRPES